MTNNDLNPSNRNIFPLTLPLSPRGEGWGEGRFGHLELGLGIYLGFGICDL